ncbi:hypothetical protein BJ508DRAFT_324718 [Ascobolus immersus RN42]|uniref:Uncharacterized protein n=1 Tax=Ascobolus immersus RN42 TaxID=1160509 RepID=A0A3N4ICF9_ASCIM|nr:hypothetical protein BJ508DRAFT_324718 [Ascobolus immersus RN42]
MPHQKGSRWHPILALVALCLAITAIDRLVVMASEARVDMANTDWEGLGTNVQGRTVMDS